LVFASSLGWVGCVRGVRLRAFAEWLALCFNRVRCELFITFRYC
jgi:hypothetical protein